MGSQESVAVGGGGLVPPILSSHPHLLTLLILTPLPGPAMPATLLPAQ